MDLEESRARRAKLAAERRERQRRGLLLLGGGVLAVVLLVVLVSSVSGGGDDGGSDSAEAAEPELVELPGGGRTILPDRRVIAYYGTSGTAALGVLGEGSPQQAARRVQKQARAWETKRRPVLPAFEFIGTIAAADPGEGGLYRNRKPLSEVREYLEAVRAIDGILIIDVQPGQADFLDEVRYFEPLLREPDVSLALDPEWSMRPGEIPGQVIGSTDAATVNRVSGYLAGIVEEEQLPQKLLIVHQFTEEMIVGREEIVRRPGLALTYNIDGFGDRPNKLSKFELLAPRRARRGPPGPFTGFKLFFDEDLNRFGPREVLKFRPEVGVINYQ